MHLVCAVTQKYLTAGFSFLNIFYLPSQSNAKQTLFCSHLIVSSSIPSVPPGPPKDLHHTDVDKTEVWLAWNWPDRNGGSDITGFLVEFQEEGEREWDEWKTVSIPESHVTGLEEGKTYRFRVRAENAIGLSRPDTTLPILCQEKLGESDNESFLAILEVSLGSIPHPSDVRY